MCDELGTNPKGLGFRLEVQGSLIRFSAPDPYSSPAALVPPFPFVAWGG